VLYAFAFALNVAYSRLLRPAGQHEQWARGWLFIETVQNVLNFASEWIASISSWTPPTADTAVQAAKKLN